MPTARRTLIFGFVTAALCWGEDARAIIVQSIDAYQRNEKLTRDYTYKVRNEIQEMRPNGDLKPVKLTLDEVFFLGGKRYLHPLQRDDKPLPADETAREQKKLDRAAAEAARLTPEQRAKRAAEDEAERAKQREAVQGIPDAFDFKLLGEEVLAGRPAWLIEAKPRPDFDGKGKALLRHLEGKFWIDKADYQWARIEAVALDSFWMGLFLLHVEKDTRITFVMTKINDHAWMPKRIGLEASARVFLVKKLDARQEVTFSGYRRYQSDSRIVSTEPSTEPQ
jgi:hypothetical protein